MPELLNVDRAYEAIEASQDRAAPLVERFEENLHELAGRFYYDDDDVKRPLNLLAKNLLTLMAHLAHRSPKHLVVPKSIAQRGSADMKALLLDHVSDELDRVKISRAQLFRGFLGPMAVTRIGSRTGSELVKIKGRLYDRGMPYILPVDLSDHVCDHEARCRDELTWEGHRYRVSKKMAMESGLFDPDVIWNIPPVSEDNGRGRTARPERISKKLDRSQREAVEKIELIDMVFYGDSGDSVVATLPAQRGYADDYLRLEQYEGPARGPYEWLEFHPLPNQLYGLPLAAVMREQHDATNQLFSTMLDQILRTRRLLIGPRAAGDDLDTARDAQDGDVLEFDDPAQVKNVDIGGLSPDFAPFAQMLQSWSDTQYVNYNLAGGGDAGTDKATIYQGMASSVNTIIDDLQNTHEDYEARISRHLDWQLSNDPLLNKTMIRRLPGGEQIDVVYDAATREDDWNNMTVSIRYGSMLRQDPQVKAANLLKLLDIAMRSLQVSMQSGGAWNTQAALRLAGQYLGFDELDEVVNDTAMQQQLAMTMQALTGGPKSGVPAGDSGVDSRSLDGPRPVQMNKRFAQPQSSGSRGMAMTA